MTQAEIYTIVITGLGSVATLITAFITYRTVREMKVQRESTYLPELVIESKRLYTYCYDKTFAPSEFSYQLKSNEEISQGFSSFLKLNLNTYNIGMAAAKKVKAEFSIDFEAVLKIIREFGSTNLSSGDFKLEASITGNSCAIQGFWGLTIYILNEESNTVRLSFIRPSSQHNDPTLIQVPDHITHLYALYSHICARQSQTTKVAEFPPLHVTLMYEDIRDKCYSKKFAVNFNWEGCNPSVMYTELNVEHVNKG